MSANNLKEAIAEIKEAYDLADYIENSGISLKQTGNRYKGLCPFHSENTPSFTVDTSFQSYHCFGCSAHGDILSFTQEQENLSFWESLQLLAESRNIDLSGLKRDGEDGDEKQEDISSLREVVKETARFFWRNYRSLEDSHAAKQEVSKRKLNVDNSLNIYGYAPEGKNKLYKYLKEKGFSDNVIEKTSVCKKGDYGFFDSWQGRLMFIIYDITGRPVGFSGRKLYEADKMGKYVNSVDSPVFNKSNVLFNINHAKKPAREENLIYVAEGQFDVMSIIQAGALNVVASSGTAFTERQSSQLRRLVGETGDIVFVFDGDSAGKKAARSVFDTDPLIHSRAYVVSFENDMDPDDYAQKYGHSELGEYIKDESHRTPIIEFVLKHEKEEMDTSTPEGRSLYLEAAAKVLSKVSNTSLRREYSKIVSLDAGGIRVEEVESAVSRVQNNTKKKVTNSENSRSSETSESNRAERDLLVSSTTEEDENDTAQSVEDVFEKIENSQYYKLFSRFMWIVLARRDLLSQKAFAFKKNLAPKEFRRIIDELIEYPNNSSLIPEKFSDERLVEHIISYYKPSEYFVHSDDEMVEELSKVIIRRLAIMRVKKQKDEKRSQLVSLLVDKNSSLDVFKRIVEEQEKQNEQIQSFIDSVTEESIIKK